MTNAASFGHIEGETCLSITPAQVQCQAVFASPSPTKLLVLCLVSGKTLTSLCIRVEVALFPIELQSKQIWNDQTDEPLHYLGQIIVDRNSCEHNFVKECIKNWAKKGSRI